MEVKKTQEQDKKKNKSGISGFLPFGIFVFSALAIGITIILLRSKA